MTGTRGLKAVYLAPTEDAAPQAPEAFGDVWEPHYYHAIESLNSVTRHSSIKNKKTAYCGIKIDHAEREKTPEWWEKQKSSRGIRRGQWYRLVFQFPVRELRRYHVIIILFRDYNLVLLTFGEV